MTTVGEKAEIFARYMRQDAFRQLAACPQELRDAVKTIETYFEGEHSFENGFLIGIMFSQAFAPEEEEEDESGS